MTFTDASVPNAGVIVNYFWDFGDSQTSPSPPPVTHNYATSGTFQVKLTITTDLGCFKDTTKAVKVYDKPIADYVTAGANCAGDSISFSAVSSTTAHGYITEYKWDFNDASPIQTKTTPNIKHKFANGGTYNVKLTIKTSDDCTAEQIKPVVVKAKPIANFEYPAQLCAQTSIQFTDISQGGGSPLSTWSWDFGDPGSGANNTAIVANPLHQFSNFGTFTVTLTVTNGNGCMEMKDSVLTISQRPVARFSADTACQGTVTTFTDQSTPAGSIVGYLWEFGDGQTATTSSPTNLYATTGVFNVKLTVTDALGCSKDTTRQVLVLGKPLPSFIIAASHCAGDSIQFTDNSSTPHGSIQEWTWNFGDGTIVGPIVFPNNQNIKHLYINGGSYDVTLTIKTSDGCIAEKTSQVQIGFPPLANFTFGTSGCALTPLQFTDLSQANGGASITTWQWNFGDPGSGANNTSSAQNPTHSFSSGGVFIVRLMVINADGCYDSLAGGKTVTINAAPFASFSADTACMASPTQFTDASTTLAGTIATWAWDFGDPSSGSNNTSTEQNPTHIFNIQGTYTVNLQVTNSNQCVKDTSLQIVVYPKPIAMFEYLASCVNSETEFTDVSTVPGSSIKTWSWNFDDPTSPNNTSSLKNPTHTFTTAGTYMVRLTVTNLANCADSVTIPVISRPAPVAAFSYVGYNCPAGKVDFQDLSTASAAAINEREWTFEPGYTSTLANPSHTFPITNMSYPVTLVVTDTYGCRDTIIISVFVKPGFVFSFSNDNVCEGYATHFNPVNQAPGDTLYSVTWNFGDPASGPNNTSQLYAPTHIFTGPGTYFVKMKAFNSDNCVDSVFRQVTVYEAPKPLFSYVGTPCDSTINFTDSTLNPGSGSIVSWQWVFGDGHDTLISAPGPGDVSHLYTDAGVYPVTLIITTSYGCIDSISRSVERFPCIQAGFTYNDSLCARYKVAFSDNSLPVTLINQWKWTWGDGSDTTYTAHSSPITHTYADSGTYRVDLKIQTLVDGTTIVDSLVSFVKVHPTPITYFSNVPVCLNQISLFRDTSKTFGVGVSQWDWTFGLNPTDTSSFKNPTHTYDTAGIYDVKLVVSNRFGCQDSLTKPTRVYGLPEARYINTAACTGDPTIFTDKSVKSDTTIRFWSWAFGDPTTLKDSSNQQNPGYRYPNTGDFDVNMIVTDIFGCTDTFDSTVRVNITPVSSFTVANDYNGKQGQVKLNNASTGAESYEWDFG
ncbi:MAG: PKD domain-containing protein, partial [Bacteroidetes bacterium]|nr:PKD domain-containing protein [Bacteroidota bacterium]